MSDQGKNTLHDNAMGWGILLVVLGVFAYIFWFFFSEEIRNLIRWIRYGEMWLMSWFIPDDYTVQMKDQPAGWHTGFEVVPEWTKQEMQGIHMAYVTALSMQPLRYVLTGLAALATWWCLFKGPKTSYRTNLDLEKLIARQSLNFPVIAPFIKFNPSDQPPRPPGAKVPAVLPLFAEALGPEEWIAYHSIPVPNGEVDMHAADVALRKQLCGRWRGVKGLKPYQQILLAAFCLKASRKRDESDVMLGRLARCWTPENKLNFGKDKKLLKQARAILKNKSLAELTISKANRHAFITTAMLRALATAREEGGVLAPATFVWLRAYDRELWYPLNNLGRQSFHMEAVGAMSHYRAEKMTDRPVPTPKMKDALDNIRAYFKSSRVRPIPQLDYSGTNKRAVRAAK